MEFILFLGVGVVCFIYGFSYLHDARKISERNRDRRERRTRAFEEKLDAYKMSVKELQDRVYELENQQ